MKKRLLLLTVLLLMAAHGLRAQTLYFPPTTGAAWDTLSPASLGWCLEEIDTLYDYLETNNSKAFLLLKDGKIVLEKYFGTFTQDSLWYWASAGKTLTAMAVGIAQEEGFLKLSDTTSHYLGTGWTSCTPAEEEKITIWNQLTMTTGLDGTVPDVHCTDDTCLHCDAGPGTQWAYHNAPYTLLDPVLEAATGMSLNAYVNTRIKAATGMNGAFFKIGYNNVFLSTPRSAARFGLLMLNGGNWNGTPVLADTAYFHQMTNTSQPLNESYGYLTWLNGKASYMVPYFPLALPGSVNPNAPTDMYAAMGKNGQFINVVPSMGMVMVRMGDAPVTSDVPFTMNDTIWIHLNDLMCGTSGMQDGRGKEALHVWPNPVQEELRISGFQGVAQVRLINQLGQEVQRWDEVYAGSAIHLGHLPAGMYVVQAVQGDSMLHARLRVQ